MNYVQTLENLRKKVATLDISEEVETDVEPVRPKGFVSSPAKTRLQPVVANQQPTYDPGVIISKTMQSLQQARRAFEKRMLDLQKESQTKSEQLRPQIRPFNAPAEEGGGFLTRPRSRTDAIMDRTNFDEGNRPRGPAGAGHPMEELAAVAQAIKDIESSGGNYQARGPEVESGMYAGERAMGAYQIMPGNLPQWSREALGREVSEEEFMASEEIQDTIFLHQMKKSYERFGTWEDAASVWFTGQPVSRSGGMDDGYMQAPDYIQRFSSNFNRYRSGE